MPDFSIHTSAGGAAAQRFSISAGGSILIGGRGGNALIAPGSYTAPIQAIPGKGGSGPDGVGAAGETILSGPVSIVMPCGEVVSWPEGEFRLTENVSCPCGQHVAVQVKP